MEGSPGSGTCFEAGVEPPSSEIAGVASAGATSPGGVKILEETLIPKDLVPIFGEEQGEKDGRTSSRKA
jgi:hypothetical protein